MCAMMQKLRMRAGSVAAGGRGFRARGDISGRFSHAPSLDLRAGVARRLRHVPRTGGSLSPEGGSAKIAPIRDRRYTHTTTTRYETMTTTTPRTRSPRILGF